MIILFAPSEGKREGGGVPGLNEGSFIFPELYPKRLEVIRQYESLASAGDVQQLYELFGIKDPGEYERYKTPFEIAPTMKAIERYDGVAYDYLQYNTLDMEGQQYIDTHVILFSNLFGPIGAADLIPDYKLKQGSSIGSFAPEKFYKKYFTDALDEMISGDEVLDLRAGYYDKFYTPKYSVVTLKFLKDGKVVSHWAKAYRGAVLRHAAEHKLQSIDELLGSKLEGLSIHEIVETKKKKEIIFTID